MFLYKLLKTVPRTSVIRFDKWELTFDSVCFQVPSHCITMVMFLEKKTMWHQGRKSGGRQSILIVKNVGIFVRRRHDHIFLTFSFSFLVNWKTFSFSLYWYSDASLLLTFIRSFYRFFKIICVCICVRVYSPNLLFCHHLSNTNVGQEVSVAREREYIIINR